LLHILFITAIKMKVFIISQVWVWQAFTVNATDAMKESRIADFLASVSAVF
jgi:hypothetical protein